MSNNTSVVGDIVVPLDKYPQINENQTVQEAIDVYKNFFEGSTRQRYAGLLVVNDKNQLVGKLSLVDIIHGMVPRLGDADAIDEFEGKDVEYPNLAFLYEETTYSECKKNQQKKIKPLMQPIDLSFPADTHILKALVMMSHRNEYNVPVIENGTILGVLGIEEIFNAMCSTQ